MFVKRRFYKVLAGTMGLKDSMLQHSLSPAKIILRGSLILLISFVAKVVLGFARNIYIGRTLGAEVLGVFTLGLLIFQFLVQLTLFGFPQVVSRLLPRYWQKKEKKLVLSIAGTFLRFSLLTSVILGGILFLTASQIGEWLQSEQLPRVLRILAVAVPLRALVNWGNNIALALEKVEVRAVVENILFPVVVLGALYFFVARGWLYGAIATAFVVASVIGAVTSIAWGRLKTYPDLSLRQVLKSFSSSYLPYAGSLFVWQMLVLLSRQVDSYAVGVFLPASAVGIYSIGLLVTRLPEYLLQALNLIYLPVVSRLIAEDKTKEIQPIYRRTVLLLIGLSAPSLVLVVAFSQQILQIFGPDFQISRATLGLIALGSFANVATGPVNALLQAFDARREFITNTVVGLVAGLIASVWLIPKWGLAGAAVANLLLLAIPNLLGLRSLYLRTGLHP